MRSGRGSFVVLSLVLSVNTASVAQVPVGPSTEVLSDATELVLQDRVVRKRIEITRTTLVPEIDGVLDDEIWRDATVISDLHQYQPVDHGEPSERSEFYLTYTDRFLYVGARLFDSNPSAI